MSLKPYSKPLSALDLKANNVWERLRDPDYYGLRAPSPQSSFAGVLCDEDADDLVIAKRAGVKCLCGVCPTCRKRKEMRKYFRKRREAFSNAA